MSTDRSVAIRLHSVIVSDDNVVLLATMTAFRPGSRLPLYTYIRINDIAKSLIFIVTWSFGCKTASLRYMKRLEALALHSGGQRECSSTQTITLTMQN